MEKRYFYDKKTALEYMDWVRRVHKSEPTLSNNNPGVMNESLQKNWVVSWERK